MYHDTVEMRDVGQSWSRPDIFPTSEVSNRWKAWFRASKKEYLKGDMKKTPGAVLGSRFDRGLPDKVRCGNDYCKVTRKGHVLGTLENKRGLVICRDCEDPSIEGSFIDIWPCHYQMLDYHIDSEIIYTVPNDASTDILNNEHLLDNIALVDRGNAPIIEIIRRLEKAKALAVLIVDNDRCNDKFECPSGTRRPVCFI